MSVIFNLYHHAKSCVRANVKMSDYFTCNVGVRQGENLSPLVLFAIYGNYKKMTKQITQARKALCCVNKGQEVTVTVPIDIQCRLFDHLVLPILLYGSEVWGYEDLLQVEVFHRKFLRLILHVNRCTPDCMIYGETGRVLF